MKRIIILAAAAILAACSSPPQHQTLEAAKTEPLRVVVVATLATNACEEVIAPLQTRAIVGTYQARRALREGRITVDQAQAVADAARDARDATQKACPTKDKPDAEQLQRAKAAIARIVAVLGETQ